MTSFLLRGAFANQFELQNYEPLAESHDLRLIASTSPLTPTSLSTTHLWSPYDLQLPLHTQILNRLVGGSHWLAGLEMVIKGADIVHTAETYYAYTHQAVQMRKQGRIKHLISTCWETIPHNNESLRTKKKWKVDARRHIDTFITPTQLAKQALIEEGVDENKIHLIRVGIDLDRFRPIKIRNKVKKILFIGRVVPEKGIVDLLRSIELNGNKYELTIIGQGNIPVKHKVRLKQLQLPYSTIHKAYQEADIFVLPSRITRSWEEQYGMVLVEAMASGMPIITTSTGAIPEVVGNTALIVPQHSPQDLSDALTKLEDKDLRIQLAKRARKRAESIFDRDKIAQEIANLYNDVI